MEAIQQARKLFLKCHHHQASLKDEDKLQLGKDIQRFITIAIKEATSRDLFENPWMLDILKSALRKRENENPDVMPLARAFQSLEKYFLLLVEQPWKPEFREIKMYGGFYRTRVKSVLPDSESVFEHAGYMVLPESCTMIYKGPMNKTYLLLLAFDCRVGQVECETIAEHYNKVKGLSMSLSDAISNILHDEYTRDKPVWTYTLSQGNGLLVNMSPNVATPPALPKREPIVNRPNTRQNVKYESENGVFNEAVFDTVSKAGIAFPPPKSPSLTSDFYSSVLPRSPLTPSYVTPESFNYIDILNNEILPELPQGTSEDHMLESLKLLRLQEASKRQIAGNSKQFRSYKDSRSVTGGIQSNCITPTFYSANGLNTRSVIAQNNFKPAPSIDEGIGEDLPTSKSYIGGQQVIPNKQVASFQQPSFDQGYRTVNPDSIYSPSSASLMYNTQQTIYHPPSVVTDGAGPTTNSKAFVPRQIAVPPPIPSRALKPKPVKDEDCLRTKMYMSAPHYTAQPVGVAHIQNEAVFSRPPMSAPGYSTVPQMCNTEPILRRERLGLGKTNSLKIGEPINSLSQQLATARTARSMDITLTSWECQSCTTLNAASNMICFACSHSRLGPDVSQPVIGETKKSCLSCTFENSQEMTHCEMCGSRLHDKFTCV